MRRFIFEVPDDAYDGICQAIADAYDWKEKVPDPENPGSEMDNPETKVAHLGRQVMSFIEGHYKMWATRNGLQQASTQVEQAVVQRAAEVRAATLFTVE